MARKAPSEIHASDESGSVPLSSAQGGRPAPEDGSTAGRQESVSSRESDHPNEPSKRNKRPQRSNRNTAATIANDLSFREAQAALELSLAQLQASDLDVETMADLYRRAESYVQRCEQLLAVVEQNVLQWDPESVGKAPQPFDG